MKDLKPFDYTALKELEFYLDFIAPVNKDQQQSELKYINELENKLYQDNRLLVNKQT